MSDLNYGDYDEEHPSGWDPGRDRPVRVGVGVAHAYTARGRGNSRSRLGGLILARLIRPVPE